MNMTQVSARDINVTMRGATGTLATGQLALLDGRSLYQDFFGFVMWDFLPVNLNEIKQIEVIRGPASAVWGANALNGVVNVITKSPREMQGTSATFGLSAASTATRRRQRAAPARCSTSAARTRRRSTTAWAFKISAGGYSQDPLLAPDRDRSRATAPRSATGARRLSGLHQQGTTQPKFDARVDYDFADGRKLSISGGVAGTDGIMHTGIGPFDIDSGSVMGYGKVNFTGQGAAGGASSPTSSTAMPRTC